MTITWRNVGAPNVGSGTGDMQVGAQLVSAGLKGLSDTAGGLHERGQSKARAELHNSLLDAAMDPDVNEKVFMRKAIDLGKQSGLTPEQSMAQVQAVKGIYDQAGALTEEQQLQVQEIQAEEEAIHANREAQNAAALAQFDQQFPQARRMNEDYTSFNAQGGLPAVMDEIGLRIEDGGDREETLTAIRKAQEKGGYEDFVVAKTIKEMGLDDPGFIFDGSLINSRKFKNRLAFNKKQYSEQSQNWLQRGQLEANLGAENAARIKASRNALTQLQRDFEKENRAIFSGK